MASDFMKGGVRYKRLKKLVNEQLADEGLVAFFIGTARKMAVQTPGVRPNAFVLRDLVADEYVLAVTNSAVHIIEMGGMGVFSAKLAGEVANIPLADADAEIDGKTVAVAGRTFHVFPYHDEDAQAFVAAVGAAALPPPPPPPPPPAPPPG